MNLTLIRMATINKTTEPEGVESSERVCIAGGDTKRCNQHGGHNGSSSRKLNINDHRIKKLNFWAYFQKNRKHKTHTDICTSMFIIALLTIAKREATQVPISG